MRSYILSLPSALQPVFIIGSTVAAAFAVSLITRSFFSVQQLEADMGLTSAVYGTLGTIYAVLIAFVVSGVWQTFSNAGAAVSCEADALTDMVFILSRLPSEKTAETRGVARAYVQSVVERWNDLIRATVRNEQPEEITLDTSSALTRSVMAIQPGNEREQIIYAEALRLMATWLDARRNRLRSARGDTAKALWGLLITGAFVLFAFHGMFVTHIWAVWAGLLLGLSLIVGLSFYLIFSLDSPFTGGLSAGPEPFQWLLQAFDRTDGRGV